MQNLSLPENKTNFQVNFSKDWENLGDCDNEEEDLVNKCGAVCSRHWIIKNVKSELITQNKQTKSDRNTIFVEKANGGGRKERD